MEEEIKAGTVEEAAEQPEAQTAEESGVADAQLADEASGDAVADAADSEVEEPGSESEGEPEEPVEVGAVRNPDDASEEDAEAAMMAMLEEPSEDDEAVRNADDASEDDAEAAMLAMLEDLPSDDDKAAADDINFGATVSPAEFQQLQEPAGKGETRNIELLLDVNLPVAIELGRTKMAISDILALGPGSVVELNKLAGEPVDLLVNGRIVARGEVVVIDENFGVRITQLLTTEERLKVLGEEK